MKFEQDVGLQTDAKTDFSTQTDNDSWLESWISEISEHLNLIETNIITDTQALLTLLDDLHNIEEELDSNMSRNEDNEFLRQKLIRMKSLVTNKRYLLLKHENWKSLVRQIIHENDEFQLLHLLEIVPQNTPFVDQLKSALKQIKQQREEELEVLKKIFDYKLLSSCSCPTKEIGWSIENPRH